MKNEQIKIASVLMELGLSYDIIELVTSLSIEELNMIMKQKKL